MAAPLTTGCVPQFRSMVDVAAGASAGVGDALPMILLVQISLI